MRTPLSALLFVSLVSIAAPAYAATACTMDAKMCPDGSYVGRDGNRNCEWQACPGEVRECLPYVCKDGTTAPSCTADGTVINYFAAPCHNHGGDAETWTSFSDVPVTHVNAEAIAYVKEKGFVEGYADGTFKPDATINRAEFTKILILAVYGEANVSSCVRSYPHHDPSAKFRDVSSNAWYAPFLCMALFDGIIGGYPDGTFRGEANINFVEAAKIFSYTLIEDRSLEETSVWYEAYVKALESGKAIPVSILRFEQPVTRGEMAEMIWRLETRNQTKPTQTYDWLDHMKYCDEWMAAGGKSCE